MTIVDQILDIATSYARDDARRLITELLEAGIEIRPARSPMSDKKPGEAIPLTRLGDFTDPHGRKATVYTAPPVISEPKPAPPSDWITERRKEMNDMSKQIVDRVMGTK